MFSVMVAAVLTKAPIQKTTDGGRPYTLANAKVVGDGGGLVYATLCAFSKSSSEILDRLQPGDCVVAKGLAGLLSWQGNDGETRTTLKIRVQDLEVVDGSSHEVRAARNRKRQAPTNAADDVGGVA